MYSRSILTSTLRSAEYIFGKVRPLSTTKSHNQANSPKKVGIVGIGTVGGIVAQNLLNNTLAEQGGATQSKFELTSLYDTKPSQIDHLRPLLSRYQEVTGRQVNASPTGGPRQVAEECDILLTCLPTPAHVKDAMTNEKVGALEGLYSGSIWIDHSTTDHKQTLDLAAKAAEKGASSLEAPITGGVALLRQGQMTCLVGGARPIYDTCFPLLRMSCLNVLYMGAIGSATITKIITNMLAAAHNVVMGEAFMLAKRSNLDLKSTFDAVRLSAGNSYVIETEAPLVFNGTYDPDFTVALHCKDLNLGYNIAREHGVPLPVLGLVEQIYNQARLTYGDDVGSSIPPKLLEDSLKTPLQIDGFSDWTYDVETVTGGSFGVVHKKKAKK